MIYNIWETNDLSQMRVEKFEKGHIFYMDNFYKYPDLVLQEILSKEPPVWKSEDKDSYNCVYFEDRRHQIFYKDLVKVYQNISEIIEKYDPGRGISSDIGTLVTNHTKFYDKKFNDYKNCWWWPHIDSGYNGIVYLSKNSDNERGTNIYRKLKEDPDYHNLPEHKRPWIKKEYWDLIAFFKSKYNRFVMFDGSEYYHGMSIDSERYFDEFRVNQVFFFTDKNFED